MSAIESLQLQMNEVLAITRQQYGRQENPTLPTTSVIIATAWDTLNHSVGSQCNRFSQLDGLDKDKEEEEEIHVDDTSPTEASLGATSASDREVTVVTLSLIHI